MNYFYCIVIFLAGIYMLRKTVRRLSIETFFSDDVDRHAKKYGVPVSLVYAVIEQESGGNPLAVSSVGARGLMQIMEPALTDFIKREKINYTFDNMFIPGKNIQVGVWYLSFLYDYYRKNWKQALRAYNAGMGNVAKSTSAGLVYANEVLEKETHYV